jgi:DHA1 family inner membrane transport protein
MPFAVYALGLAAFAIGTAEFVISGILPPVAFAMNVAISTAGLLVSAYALGVAIGGPLLTLVAARFDQRQVLIILMAVFAGAQMLCAIAPDYGLLLLARLLSSLCHGVFFGAGNVVVMQLVPPERRGKAFAVFIGGITIANLLGLPGGTAIAVWFGWRASFVAVGVLGLIAMLVLILRLPTTGRPSGPGSATIDQFRALLHQQIWLSYLVIALTMTGVMCFATYSVPLLMHVTGLSPEIVPFFLLINGAGAVLGIWMGGELTDWKPMPSLIVVLVLQSLVFLALGIWGTSPNAMFVMLFVSGIVGFAFSTPLQARIVHAARYAPNLASALTSTAFNIGIAAGAFMGATLLELGFPYADLPAVGIVTALLAAAVAGLSWWLERRAKPAVA